MHVFNKPQGMKTQAPKMFSYSIAIHIFWTGLSLSFSASDPGRAKVKRQTIIWR